MRRLLLLLSCLAPIVVLFLLSTTVTMAREVLVPEPSKGNMSVLEKNLLVTWYGNPHTSLMGVLGQYTGEELADGLQKQADAYSGLTQKRVLPGYQLIAVVAQDSPGSDDKWRRRESEDVINSMLEQTRSRGFKLILDVQLGHSTVEDELAYLRPWLEQPDVYLALDPEFDMWQGQTAGIELGHTTAAEVNYALAFLEGLVQQYNLPPKVLIVHQFTLSMLPDKENIRRSPVVDLVLDMDGFGTQVIKRDTFKSVTSMPLEYVGVKLFYKHDPDLYTPQEVMQLDPQPSVVIYQ